MYAVAKRREDGMGFTTEETPSLAPESALTKVSTVPPAKDMVC